MGMSACFAWENGIFRAEVADSGEIRLYAGLPPLDGPEDPTRYLGRGEWDSRVLRPTWGSVEASFEGVPLGQPFLERAEGELALCTRYLEAVDRGEVDAEGDWEPVTH